jgi:hypothetical protein
MYILRAPCRIFLVQIYIIKLKKWSRFLTYLYLSQDVKNGFPCKVWLYRYRIRFRVSFSVRFRVRFRLSHNLSDRWFKYIFYDSMTVYNLLEPYFARRISITRCSLKWVQSNTWSKEGICDANYISRDICHCVWKNVVTNTTFSLSLSLFVATFCQERLYIYYNNKNMSRLTKYIRGNHWRVFHNNVGWRR